MGLRLFVCFRSLGFIALSKPFLFCLFCYEFFAIHFVLSYSIRPCLVPLKKKSWGCGGIERNEGLYVEDEGFVVYVHSKACLFHFFLFLFANNPVFIEVNRLLFDEKWVCFFIVI